jgi:hypothetical protein
MTLKTTESAVRPTKALHESLSAAFQIKRETRTRRAVLDRPLINVDILQAIYTVLFEQTKTLDRAVGVAGISDSAIADTGDPAYDIVAETATVVAKVDEILVWIEANNPLSADGSFDFLRFDNTQVGGIGQRQITTAEAVPLATLIDELLPLLD